MKRLLILFCIISGCSASRNDPQTEIQVTLHNTDFRREDNKYVQTSEANELLTCYGEYILHPITTYDTVYALVNTAKGRVVRFDSFNEDAEPSESIRAADTESGFNTSMLDNAIKVNDTMINGFKHTRYHGQDPTGETDITVLVLHRKNTSSFSFNKKLETRCNGTITRLDYRVPDGLITTDIRYESKPVDTAKYRVVKNWIKRTKW